MEKNMRFNMLIKDAKKINPLFTKCRVAILYTGHNRNNSYFTKESVEKAKYSIFNIPVVGEYLSEKDNFGGHGGKLEITDTDIKYIQTTIPYGVVGENAELYWENITEADGTINEYLIVDGVYLWTGRYEELNVLIEQQKLGHSMEIEVNEGNFAVIDGKETFRIDDFIFSALCMLGVDKGENTEDHVEPCFESSNIQVSYSLDKDSFKHQFNQMLDELKFSMNKGGNTKMENEVVQEVTEIVEEVEFTEEVLEEAETVIENEVIETTEEDVTEEIKEVVEEAFENTEEVDVVEASEESPTEETFTKDFVEGLNAQITLLTSELDELKSYKRSREEQDLASKFANKLTVDEIKEVFDASSELSMDLVEEKLLVKFGKKNFSLVEEKVSNKVSLDVNKTVVTEADEPYNGLFSKYLEK